MPQLSSRHRDHVLDPRCDKGSFLVTGAVFFFLFLFVAALGVDVSQYFLRINRVQAIADNAATAGAQALNQYADTPTVEPAYATMLRYVENHQGPEYRDLYEVYSDTRVEGMYVKRHETAGGEPYYRVGLLTYGTFEPYFLPIDIFGNAPQAFARTAVARIDGKRLQKRESKSWECGVYADELLTVYGNEVNAWNTSLCGNADIDAGGGHSTKHVGDVYRVKGNSVTCPKHNDCKSITDFKDPRPIPSFRYEDPALFDVQLSNHTAWGEGVCGGGQEMPGAQFEDGSGVCVKKRDADGDGTKDQYVFRDPSGNKPHDKGRIESDAGGAISLYADTNVHIDYNGGGLTGGLYSEGTIHVSKNDHEFAGDPDKLGGLALWAEKRIDIDYNDIRIRGIVGSEGDMSMGRSGGGAGPDVDGVLVSDGAFEYPSNSSYASITYDTSTFSQDALEGAWSEPIIVQANHPLFASAQIYLVD